MMNEYKVTITANYEKALTVHANTFSEAQEKVDSIMFDTDLINFDEDNYIGSEVNICNASGDDFEDEYGDEDEYEDECEDEYEAKFNKLYTEFVEYLAAISDLISEYHCLTNAEY